MQSRLKTIMLRIIVSLRGYGFRMKENEFFNLIKKNYYCLKAMLKRKYFLCLLFQILLVLSILIFFFIYVVIIVLGGDLNDDRCTPRTPRVLKRNNEKNTSVIYFLLYSCLYNE